MLSQIVQLYQNQENYQKTITCHFSHFKHSNNTRSGISYVNETVSANLVIKQCKRVTYRHWFFCHKSLTFTCIGDFETLQNWNQQTTSTRKIIHLCIEQQMIWKSIIDIQSVHVHKQTDKRQTHRAFIAVLHIKVTVKPSRRRKGSKNTQRRFEGMFFGKITRVYFLRCKLNITQNCPIKKNILESRTY